MCFNKEVSLLIFILSAALFTKLYYKAYKSNDVVIKQRYNLVATVVLVISLIQLLEFFMFLNQYKNRLNSLLSFLIHLTLCMQIVTIFAMGYNNIFKDNLAVVSLFALFLFSFVASTLHVDWSNVYSIKDSCRLNWGVYSNKHWSLYLFQVLYFILLSVFFYKIFGILGLVALLITFFMSIAVAMKCDSMNFGSLWCFAAIFLIVIVGIFNKDM